MRFITRPLRVLPILLIAALLFYSCNKDEVNDLNDRVDALQNALEQLKVVSNASSFKNRLLEEAIEGNLVKQATAQNESDFLVEFENGESLLATENLVQAHEVDMNAWKVMFTLADESQVEASMIGSPLQIETANIKLNPYNNSPLAATVAATYPVKGKVKINVIGQDGEKSNISKTFDNYAEVQNLEIFGLYPNYNNEVEIIFLDKQNRERSKSTIRIQTSALPSGFPEFEIVKQFSSPEANTVFLMDFRPSNIPFMVDGFGKIRWYSTGFSVVTKYALQRFKNGNMGFGRSGNGQGSIFEYTMLGKLIREYSFFPTYEDAHHDVFEMANGNFLVPVNKTGAPTIEDYVLQMDRNSGQITNVWDLNLSLPRRNTFIHDDVDWVHVNAVIHDERDNSIIISGQRQGLFKLTWNNQLKWILAAPEGWTGYEEYLLSNSTPGFQWIWGQHAPLILPNGNLLLFDNGFGRNYSNAEKYSRAVEFSINESTKGGTLSTVWEYGSTRGEELFSPIISDVDYLPETKTRLISSGSLAFNVNYTTSQSIISSWTNDPDKCRIIEVDDNKNVLFEMLIKSNVATGAVYRSEKLKIY
jgi:arylsulfate sulfotransferase